MSNILANFIEVAPRFQRSVRIDQDFGNPESLDGYVLLSSASHVITTLIHQIRETPQRAFTWTGPYGGGKSSLALLLATLLGPTGKAKNIAKRVLGSELLKEFSGVLPSSIKGWLVVPVVGHRGGIVEEIGRVFLKQKGKRAGKNYTSNPRELIADLCHGAEDRGKKSGVLIVIDEMGKFLEGSAERGEDIYFLQDLAEAASRSKGKLVVVGILHQAFEHYASRLGRQTRDEWAKIQGRFSDIPISSSVDELVDLVGRAIDRSEDIKPEEKIIAKVSKAVRYRRPSLPVILDKLLYACWPLHPVSAMLLGPISKHRFGQNERSCFAFLTSAEPEGFQDYLHSTSTKAVTPYDPSQLWDYLQANLEPSILASPDGHRWAQAAETVDRCISKGSKDHVRLAKIISVIDLFKNGSGLAADDTILKTCLSGISAKSVDALLDDMINWSVIVYRKHLGAYGVFAGSDFDIESAIAEVQEDIDELDYSALNRLANVQPILAKALYHQTGALWWLDTEIISLQHAAERVKKYAPQNGAAGCMFLAIPSDGVHADPNQLAQSASDSAPDQIILIGVPGNSYMIREYARELLALELLQTRHPELEGDHVARKELQSRLSMVSNLLQNELQHAFTSANWHTFNSNLRLADSAAINKLASKLIGERYSGAPHIHSELLNRQKPSSNAMAARRNLLHSMVQYPESEALTFEGFSAERGVYETTLRSLGLHSQKNDGRWYFKEPDHSGYGETLRAMWEAAEDLFETSSDAPIKLEELFEKWRRPPFGIKEGLLPIYVFAFMLSKSESIAIYHKGYYQPYADVLMVDRVLQKPIDYSIRKYSLKKYELSVLSYLADGLAVRTGSSVASSPIGVARRLVKQAYALPIWSKNTRSVSVEAQQLREVLLNAKDPIQSIFEDIPKITKIPGTSKKAAEKLSLKLLELFDELQNAYQSMLFELRRQMIQELGRGAKSFLTVQNNISQSATLIQGHTGDARLQTFASRINRLTDDPISMEQIAGLLISKPPRDWSDEETKLATNALADLCFRFRQEEALQAARLGHGAGETISFVVGAGEKAEMIVAEYDYSGLSDEEFKDAQKELERHLELSGLSGKAKLALIARVGVKLGAKHTA